MNLKAIPSLMRLLAVAALSAVNCHAAGVLTPVGTTAQSIQTRSHHVDVVINNGFAKTTFTQVFYNPNAQDLEAVYRFPVPKSASLSEMILYAGEDTLRGEVIKKEDAERIYAEAKNNGEDAGLATRESYQHYTFKVHPVRAQSETQIEVVYYQPIDIDTGMGRYTYPLEEGGTDEVAASFWTQDATIQNDFSVRVQLKSAHPVTDVRTPNFGGVAQQDADGHWNYLYERKGGSLDQDFVFYYRLADHLPAQVEVIPYKAATDQPGTFMMILTPGLDLAPLTEGADYLFVLDKSGSMNAKIHTLADGVEKALGKLAPHDRFKVVVFDDQATALSRDWIAATPENVTPAINALKATQASGGTNIYAGLVTALKDLDNDRATNLILVTDGVTNQGIVEPARFHELMKQHDLRVFGFLMGNSANWPLMRVICDASDGFYTSVSTSDDIVGKILQAKSKITHASLHNAELKIRGVKTHNVTQNFTGKIFRGQQLVLFGQYDSEGTATLTLEAQLTGEDKTYTTQFNFPAVDTDHPEIERLWAMSQIEEIELLKNIGRLPSGEASDAIADLGVAYQLVTDETSMLLLRDASFAQHGIDRHNLARSQREHQAQAQRAAKPVQNYRVDTANPMFEAPAPGLGGSGGGGALGWEMLVLLAGLLPFLRGGNSGRRG